MEISNLKVGTSYSNFEICEIFKCGNNGRIRISHNTNCLALISYNKAYEGKGSPYQDHWEDDILHYRGMSFTENQIIRGRKNNTLKDSASNGVNLHLFEVMASKKRIYRGLVELAGEPYTEIQKDKNGVDRNVIMFPLKIKDIKASSTLIEKLRPIIGITMGDPTGIGPEIILKAMAEYFIYKQCSPLIIGDFNILTAAKKIVSSSLEINPIKKPSDGQYRFGTVDVINFSKLSSINLSYGRPDMKTSEAMVRYIIKSIDLALEKKIDGVVTCPINKKAMNLAGYRFNGHTELFAEKTGTKDYIMMLAGKKFKTTLVTIHVPLKEVPSLLTKERIIKVIQITGDALIKKFGIKRPKIAVAALNPHAGENNMFGSEEEEIIIPSISEAQSAEYEIVGPLPADTLFYNALKGDYDAVVSMYHDQGLIPFKMIHFEDGVNTTLGLPIIRTSVDHGTAYDIAGTGKANHYSLVAAIKMAAEQSRNIIR